MNDTVFAPIFELTRDSNEKLRALCDEHHAFVHRSLRRLGVPESEVADASQSVLLVAARRLETIAKGSERAFLFGVVLRTASDVRRRIVRRREVFDESVIAQKREPSPSADVVIDRSRARKLLDDVLDALPMDLRAVLVLTELEEMTMAEIATLLDLPPGTVASRLRRAREVFADEARKARSAIERRGFR